jgi:hypothetical protein
MFAIIYLLGTFVADLLKSRRQHYPETTTADFFDSIDPQQNLDWQVAAPAGTPGLWHLTRFGSKLGTWTSCWRRDDQRLISISS